METSRSTMVLAALLAAISVQCVLAQPDKGNPNPSPTDVIITSAAVTYTGQQPDFMTIKGTFFGAATGTVILGDQFLTPISWTNTQIVVDVPSSTPLQSYLLTVIRGSNPQHGAFLTVSMGMKRRPGTGRPHRTRWPDWTARAHRFHRSNRPHRTHWPHRSDRSDWSRWSPRPTGCGWPPRAGRPNGSYRPDRSSGTAGNSWSEWAWNHFQRMFRHDFI